MWPWFLAGTLVLLNVATVLIAVAAVRYHLRRAVAGVRRSAERDAAAEAQGARPRAGETVRQGSRQAGELDARLARRSEELRRLLAEADRSIAELRRLSPAPAGPAPDGPPGPGDPRRGEVLRLARQNVDPVEIARRTGLDVGEVELVLSLYGAAPVERA